MSGRTYDERGKSGNLWRGQAAATVAVLLLATLLLSACARLNLLAIELGLQDPEPEQAAVVGPPPQTHAEAEDETVVEGEVPVFVVSHAQVLLRDLGSAPGAIDGVRGPQTTAAIRKFQSDQGLSADGRVSAALLAQLQVARRDRMVRDAQTSLARLGYKIGAIDGRLGPRTRAAISVFQEAEGLPVTGKVTPELGELLASKLRAAPPEPVSPPDARWSPVAKAAEADAGLAEGADREPPHSPIEQTAEAGAGDVQPDRSLARVAERSEGIEPKVGGTGAELPPSLAARPPLSLSRASPHDESDGRPLANGDRVRLTIGDAGANVIERQIDESGQLELPGGLSVIAAGLTLTELQHAITIKLVESFLLNLNVDVRRPGMPADEGAPAESGSSQTSP